METIFKNGLGSTSRPTGDNDTDFKAYYVQRVDELINDALSFEQDYRSAERERAMKYFDGLEPGISGGPSKSAYNSGDPRPEDEDVGKSTIVSTDVRDTIMAILPSLVRIFMSATSPVDYLPNRADQADAASQATDVARYIIWDDNEGFMILYSAFKDALMFSEGVITWWVDDNVEYSVKSFINITEEQLMVLLDTEDNIIDMHEKQNEDGTYSVDLRYAVSKPIIRLEAVPPEEFRISRNAKSVREAGLVGWERIVQPSYLVQRGYDREEVNEMIGGQMRWTDERYMRNPGLTDEGNITDGVLFGEYYIRIDSDNDGIDELRYITTVGESRLIVEDYEVDYAPFTLFGPDPIPHTAIGSSITDNVDDLQKIKTNLIRGILDSLANSINPRTVINETLTNVEDAMNDEQGAIIRTRTSPMEAVHFLVTPFVGQQAQPMVDYMDQLRASRTGITEASKGLDPQAMQSTAVVGIDAIVSGAQERIELIARILAETGLKPLYKGLLREMVRNPNMKRTLELRGEWVEVQPSTYDETMRVKTNPTLGKGTDMTKLMALQSILAEQKAIVGSYGIKNPVVGPTELRNTMVDMLELVDIRNPSRYFKEITPEIEQSIMETPDEPDPTLLLAQAEMENVRSKTAKNVADIEVQENKQQLDDDFRRDKLMVDATLKAAEIEIQQEEIKQRPLLEAMNQPPELNDEE